MSSSISNLVDNLSDGLNKCAGCNIILNAQIVGLILNIYRPKKMNY